MATLGEKPADRWLQVGGRLLIVAVLVVSIIDKRGFVVSALWISGTALLVAGLSLNIVARIYLGRFYSEAVRIRPDHRLIRNGPYRFVRHPIYLSVILFSLSAPIILGSLYGFIVSLALIPMLLHRIRIEEKYLISKFGREYIEYAYKTRKLIPYIY
ncbi:MAG TPA: isoprenylcysteine carboxylmethyltransferase family protein [Candidatus Bathyarchaeia archaeon]|jgi:protein-S-isoprenylcysteine O-methyltransferase Ste14|nr:isoprenylcysteine carboxylmethyltransferase family protein [Candidatus Bathyarchaeia archaeon]